jgi:hypothetical protein
MKPLLMLCCLLFGFSGQLARAADWQADYARLLAKYVIPSGVRYKDWKHNSSDVEMLQTVVEAIGKSKRDDLAFYLNAYNAWILHEVLASYPIRSIKDPVFMFFLSDRIVVGGVKMSFNHLEKDIIREKFSDPRVHFALNCASKSCPTLAAQIYVNAKIEQQLDRQTRLFIDSAKGVRVSEKGAEISQIFDWYKADFTGGVLAFINRYRTQPIPETAKISFQDYNWALNDAR